MSSMYLIYVPMYYITMYVWVYIHFYMHIHTHAILGISFKYIRSYRVIL